MSEETTLQANDDVLDGQEITEPVTEGQLTEETAAGETTDQASESTDEN